MSKKQKQQFKHDVIQCIIPLIFMIIVFGIWLLKQAYVFHDKHTIAYTADLSCLPLIICFLLYFIILFKLENYRFNSNREILSKKGIERKRINKLRSKEKGHKKIIKNIKIVIITVILLVLIIFTFSFMYCFFSRSLLKDSADIIEYNMFNSEIRYTEKSEYKQFIISINHIKREYKRSEKYQLDFEVYTNECKYSFSFDSFRNFDDMFNYLNLLNRDLIEFKGLEYYNNFKDYYKLSEDEVDRLDAFFYNQNYK